MFSELLLDQIHLLRIGERKFFIISDGVYLFYKVIIQIEVESGHADQDFVKLLVFIRFSLVYILHSPESSSI